MKKYFYLILILLFLFSQTIYFGLALTPSEEIIGTVNGDNLYLIEFNRLYNAQKKQFHNIYHFDLFSPPTENPRATLKREEQIKEANKEGLFISNEEVNNALEGLITQEGGIENIQSKAKANSLSIEDIRSKLEENLLLDKYFESHIKPKLVDLMIDELLLLQEAKARNIQVPEEEVLKRLNAVKDKQGGEEGFQTFLAENNATLEDAQNEIKNQVLYDLVKSDIQKEKINLKPYLSEKKSNSVIVIYNNKLSPQEEQITTSEASELPGLRTNPYPTITKSKVEEIKKLEEKTNEIVTGLEKKPDVPQQSNSSEETKKEMLQALNKDLQTLSSDEVIDVAKIKEPVILQPISKEQKTKDRKQRAKQGNLISTLGSQVSKFKDKVKKIKLARQEKKMIKEAEVAEVENKTEEIAKENLLPGEEIKQNNETANQQIETQQAQVIQPQATQTTLTRDLLKEFEELRQKIEQRQFATKKGE